MRGQTDDCMHCMTPSVVWIACPGNQPTQLSAFEKQQRKEVTGTMAECKRIKMSAADALDRARRIKEQIATQPHLACFNTEHFLGTMSLCQNGFDQCWQTSFGKAFREANDIAKVKKGMDVNAFIVQGKELPDQSA